MTIIFPIYNISYIGTFYNNEIPLGRYGDYVGYCVMLSMLLMKMLTKDNIIDEENGVCYTKKKHCACVEKIST
jgi:hypothetical protein